MHVPRSFAKSSMRSSAELLGNGPFLVLITSVFKHSCVAPAVGDSRPSLRSFEHWIIRSSEQRAGEWDGRKCDNASYKNSLKHKVYLLFNLFATEQNNTTNSYSRSKPHYDES